MYKYTVLGSQYVFATIGKGTDVLIVDFKGLKVMDCNDLTVNQINYYIASSDSVFYTRTEVTE